MRNYCRSDLEIASKVAIRSWLNEGQLSEKIQNSHIIDESLGREWLNYWMLARTAPLENRVPLYQYMTRARKRLMSRNLSGAQAYRLVQCIANEGANLNGTSGRPLSLVSKLAFSCQPQLFAPYDKRARAALRLCGHRTEGDYPAFMDAFNRELRPFKAELRKAGISAKNNIIGARVTMSQKLFERRTFDKYLMLVGGFSRERMKKIASGAQQKQHAGH